MKNIEFMASQISKIKIIVCDLDGTLLDRHKRISINTINYLIKLQQNGYILVLATGRFFYELKPYIKQLEMEKYHSYVICCNGREIHDLSNQQVKFFDALNNDEVSNLITLALDHKINIRANYNNSYQMIVNPWIYRIVPLIKLFTRRYPDLRFYPHNYQVPWNKLGKLALLSSPQKLVKFETHVKNNYPGQYQYYYTHRFCIELVKNSVNKYDAVKYICLKKNLTLANVLAFGDSGNDKKLLEHAGIGITMKNGFKPLKQEARYISFKSNHQEGVLNMLEYIFSNTLTL